jgi:hypothetical protein
MLDRQTHISSLAQVYDLFSLLFNTSTLYFLLHRFFLPVAVLLFSRSTLVKAYIPFLTSF